MKDNELIAAIVESFIVENNFKFKKSDIKHILEESIDVKIKQIKEDHYEDVRVLSVYYGTKNRRCVCFTIQGDQIKIEQII